MAKKHDPTLRDELMEKLKRMQEEKAMEENRRQMPQYRPGGFAQL